LLKRVKDSVSAGIDRHRREIAPSDDAFAVDHEERALAKSIVLTVGLILLRDRPLGLKVGEKRKVDMVMLREGIVTPDAIDRDAKDLGAILFKLRERLVVEGHLITANGAPVRGIKREDHGPTGEIRERQTLIRRDVQREVWGLRAGFQELYRFLWSLSSGQFDGSACHLSLLG
jgi:hypothetical protein